MSGLFKNKYRIASARLQSSDYGSEGMYFVTICTRDRKHYFGNVRNGEIQLSEIGEIAWNEWNKSPGLRPDMNLELGDFVVMTNHMHGILIIGSNKFNDATIYPKNQFGPQRKNLASVIRGYKSAVTTYARKNNIPFDWQSRFHDHIIRSMDEYRRISKYIVDNPRKWNEDNFYFI